MSVADCTNRQRDKQKRTIRFAVRQALIDYCRERAAPESLPIGAGLPKATSLDSGQALAAEKNRERNARLGIIGALQKLGIPQSQWPAYIRDYHRQPAPPFRHRVSPRPFQPPVFDRLSQSAQDWRKTADQAWKKHRDQFLEGCEFWERIGVDEKIVQTQRPRGAGKGNSNATHPFRNGTNGPHGDFAGTHGR